MAKGREKAKEYHQQFAERIIKALKEGTAPWQKALEFVYRSAETPMGAALFRRLLSRSFIRVYGR